MAVVPPPARDVATLIAFVPGVPAPKGSMRYVGNGRMIEQVKASVPWRERVNEHVLRAGEVMGYAHSKTDPVEVTLRFIVPRPKNAKRRLWPFTRGSGDVDKLSRNVLDAISDTRKAPGVLRDDSCVVMLHASKHYQSAKDPHIGVSIIIQNARDEDA